MMTAPVTRKRKQHHDTTGTDTTLVPAVDNHLAAAVTSPTQPVSE